MNRIKTLELKESIQQGNIQQNLCSHQIAASSNLSLQCDPHMGRNASVKARVQLFTKTSMKYLALEIHGVLVTNIGFHLRLHRLYFSGSSCTCSQKTGITTVYMTF